MTLRLEAQASSLRGFSWPALAERSAGWVLPIGIGLAVVERLAFWALAHPTFEDALITYTHAKNAAEGLGLTHHAGEPPVQGFTSVLSVLIPYVGELIHEGFGLDLLRIVSLVAAVVTIVAAYRLGQRLGLGPWPMVLLLGYLAIDRNQVFFGVAGMETQLAVAILLAGIWALVEERPIALGVAVGLALLVRPDFLLWVGPAGLATLTWGRRRFLRVLVPGALLVGPWLIFTTLYYGSPIPNTITSKATAYVPPVGDAATWLGTQLADHVVTILRTFMPFYEDSLVVSGFVPPAIAAEVAVAIIALVVIGLWRTHGHRAWWPVGAFFIAYLLFRVFLLPTTYYEWYLPPFTAVALLYAAVGLQALASMRRTPTLWRAAAAPIALAILLPLSMHVPFEIAFRMQVPEEATRIQVASYLGGHVQPGQTLTAEAAGYIGLATRHATLYDWPGLTSKVATAALESLPPDHRTEPAFIDRLRPDWLALRPWELADLRSALPATAAQYHVVTQFDEPGVDWSGAGRPTIGIAGYEMTALNAEWIVLRRDGP